MLVERPDANTEMTATAATRKEAETAPADKRERKQQPAAKRKSPLQPDQGGRQERAAKTARPVAATATTEVENVTNRY